MLDSPPQPLPLCRHLLLRGPPKQANLPGIDKLRSPRKGRGMSRGKSLRVTGQQRRLALRRGARGRLAPRPRLGVCGRDGTHGHSWRPWHASFIGRV